MSSFRNPLPQSSRSATSSARTFAQHRTRKIVLASFWWILLTVALVLAQAPADSTYRVTERGQDFAVYECVTTINSETGAAELQTNRFTLLENALHYFADGEWKESEDLIELFAGGAIARHGPNKAIFSPDLNAEAVFDLEMANGKRLRGGVRAIQLTDAKTGQTVVLATVKASAPGELHPPDRIVYPDAFAGLAADVVLVWRHNLFSHDIVIRDRPKLPAGWDPASVRLEVITEFVEAPEPDINQQWRDGIGEAPIADDVVIRFGGLDLIMGAAFPVAGDTAFRLGGLNSSEEGTPVLKQWQVTEDGARLLIESVSWADAELGWKDLPLAEPAEAASALEGTLATAPASAGMAMTVAQRPYEPEGYVLDFVTVPGDGTPTTLQSGETYYIRTSYYSGSSVTVQSGCTVKYKNGAYMLLYGPVSFPSSMPYAVFTSRNDDLYGQRIEGVQNEMDSDGDPTSHLASNAIWIYYVNFSTTIRYTQIRWATQGVRYDTNPGGGVTHYFQNSLLQNCPTGVYLSLYSWLSLSGVQKCDVAVDSTGGGSVSGYMTTWSGCDTVVNSAANDLNNPDPQQNTQNETAVTVSGGKIVAAWMDTNKGHNSLGAGYPACYTECAATGELLAECHELPRFLAWGVSSNGGQSFVDKGEPPRFQYTRLVAARLMWAMPGTRSWAVTGARFIW